MTRLAASLLLSGFSGIRMGLVRVMFHMHVLESERMATFQSEGLGVVQPKALSYII